MHHIYLGVPGILVGAPWYAVRLHIVCTYLNQLSPVCVGALSASKSELPPEILYRVTYNIFGCHSEVRCHMTFKKVGKWQRFENDNRQGCVAIDWNCGTG
jgi:hypothetical protein